LAQPELLVAIRDAEIDDSGLRDQALRSAKSACLNIAEASGRESMADQKRVYAIARGEASEATAAIQIAALSGDCTTDSGEEGYPRGPQTLRSLDRPDPPAALNPVPQT